MLLEQQHVDLIAVFVDNRAQLRRAALKILGDPARAEDVVQDAYLKVSKTEDVLNVNQPLAYLYQMSVTLLLIGIGARCLRVVSLRARKKDFRFRDRWEHRRQPRSAVSIWRWLRARYPNFQNGRDGFSNFIDSMDIRIVPLPPN